MTATALSVVLAFSLALQDVPVDEATEAPPPIPAADPTTTPDEAPAVPAEDSGSAPDVEDNRNDEDERAAEPDDEADAGAQLGAAIGSASACGAADAMVGALFGVCGLCVLVTSQDDSFGQSVGQACSLFLGCPASLAVGVVPPLAALAGGCLGAMFDDADAWGAALGALPGVLVGVGGLAFIVTGLALGMQSEGQGRDILVPWPLAPSSPPTAPDSLTFTAGLGIALIAGPLAVVGAALGGMAPDEDDAEDGTEVDVEGSLGSDELTAGSPSVDGRMR